MEGRRGWCGVRREGMVWGKGGMEGRRGWCGVRREGMVWG